MPFALLALLSAVIAGVGLFRGAWLEAAPGVGGVVLALMGMRASALFKASGELKALGGFPFSLGGAITLGSVAVSLASFFVKVRQLTLTAAGFASIGFVLLMIAALRFSTKAERRQGFYLLALICLANAAATGLLLSRAI